MNIQEKKSTLSDPSNTESEFFKVNSFFEFELAAYPERFHPNKNLLKRHESMEKIMLPILPTGTKAILDFPLHETAMEEFYKPGIQLPEIIPSASQLQGNLSEWGKMHTLLDGELTLDTKKTEESRNLNSKFNQTLWKSKYSDKNLPTAIIHSSDSTGLDNKYFPCILRPEFSFAGSGYQFAQTSIELIKKIPQNKRFAIEKWSENRISDFSILLDSENGQLKFLGSTENLSDKKGKYTGTVIQNNKNVGTESEDMFCLASKIYLSEEIRYTGPLSMDGFQYQDDQKNSYTQPLSEFNFRYTMGRVLHEFLQKMDLQTNYTRLEILHIKQKSPVKTLQDFKKLKEFLPVFLCPITPILDAHGEVFPWVNLIFSGKKDDVTQMIERCRNCFNES